MSDIKYRVTLTAEQLQALCVASETCSRLVMGFGEQWNQKPT